MSLRYLFPFPGAAAFTPLSLANCVFWTPNYASTVSVDGSNNIGQSNDQTTNSYNFTQATTAKKPLLVTAQHNGNAVARFTAASNSALNATLGSSNFSTFTAFVALKPSSIQEDSGIVGSSVAPATGCLVLEIGTSSNFAIWVVDVGRKASTGANTAATGTRYRVIYTYDGTTLVVYINGSSAATDTYTGGFFPYQCNVGVPNGFFSIGADIDHTGLYSSVLNSTQIASLDTFLANN